MIEGAEKWYTDPLNNLGSLSPLLAKLVIVV